MVFLSVREFRACEPRHAGLFSSQGYWGNTGEGEKYHYRTPEQYCRLDPWGLEFFLSLLHRERSELAAHGD